MNNTKTISINRFHHTHIKEKRLPKKCNKANTRNKTNNNEKVYNNNLVVDAKILKKTKRGRIDLQKFLDLNRLCLLGLHNEINYFKLFKTK